MQPIDHTSLTSFHLQQPKMTSGARYWRVLIISEWCSSSKVAPPKSIILISSDAGYQYFLAFFDLGLDDEREEEEEDEEEEEEDEDLDLLTLFSAFSWSSGFFSLAISAAAGTGAFVLSEDW